MGFNSFYGVVGAGGTVTACRWVKGGDEVLVKVDEVK